MGILPAKIGAVPHLLRALFSPEPSDPLERLARATARAREEIRTTLEALAVESGIEPSKIDSTMACWIDGALLELTDDFADDNDEDDDDHSSQTRC